MDSTALTGVGTSELQKDKSCGQEPSRRAVVQSVRKFWTTISPAHDSKSDGEVERAVQTVHGLGRTLIEDFEHRSAIRVASGMLFGVTLATTETDNKEKE